MHKLPKLLLSESQRMIEIVDLLRIRKFERIYLANLNLRLFLYRMKDGEILLGLSFLLIALGNNPLEVFSTISRIMILRIRRFIGFSEKDSYFLPHS